MRVGACLQCQQPHDAYSGRVCCTVCRQPTLLCPPCVASSPHPGEFHCPQHLWLKHCYFTVLDGFSDGELRAQLQALAALWAELLPLKAKGKNRRRTLERQRRRVEEELQARAGGDKAQAGPGEAPLNPKARPGWGFWRD